MGVTRTQIEELLRPFVAGGVQRNGEQRLRCPAPEHDDSEASASVNWTKKVWHCMGCDAGGTLRALARSLSSGSWSTSSNGAQVIDLDSRRNGTHNHADLEATEPLSEAKVLSYVEAYQRDAKLQRWLEKKRGINPITADKFDIGWDARRKRIVLPVRNEDEQLVNLRRYSPTGKPKMKNAAGRGSPPRLYPQDNLHHDTLILAEGEWDALLSTQCGFPAITGTHGSSTWFADWSKQLAGKTIFICYDNDKEGRVGAKKAARALSSRCKEVHIIQLPVDGEHEDLSDWWLVYGGTPDQFTALLDSARRDATDDTEDHAQAEAQPATVKVIGSMDSTTNGQALAMSTTITGRKNPTYSVPHEARLVCTLDAGPKCKTCPMNTDHEGEVRLTIDPHDVRTISRFIDAPEKRVVDILREEVGAAKCQKFEYDEAGSTTQTVEELYVTGNVDDRNNVEDADYTVRRIYNVGSHDTRTNMPALIVGTTVPNPKDRRNEFISWSLDETQTSLDSFTMTPDLYEQLRVFQPARRQSPLAKCMEIAKDLSDNVTGITGRERLHVAMDLVYHSLLHFPFDRKVITRGWLEFLVVGDTRTGKSETASHLASHYGLGHVVGCEGATFAGLVGAVKQVSDSWVITWGEITINDRRLVVLDEASGLSQQIISQLSDIRSRGMAQLTKAESQQTRARCRMIWISNARRDKGSDESVYDGIDIIKELIGNPEDIARFDFAMSVSSTDVPIDRIHDLNRERVPHVYTGPLCRSLILWAWSRQAEHVQWQQAASEAVYRGAEWLGRRYVEDPPLIQRTNVREKVARLAVALAARTFSTDRTGTLVLVKLAHVKDAVAFLDKLYSYDNFGYRRVSERAIRNKQIAGHNVNKVREFLASNRNVLEFLLDRRTSFRAQDMAEMTGSDMPYINHVLSKLSEWKMIRKSRAQVVMEPELHQLLREMSNNRKKVKT